MPEGNIPVKQMVPVERESISTCATASTSALSAEARTLSSMGL